MEHHRVPHRPAWETQPNSHQRRHIMLGTVLAIPLWWMHRVLAAQTRRTNRIQGVHNISLDAFIRTCADICGHPPSTLNRDMARALLQNHLQLGEYHRLQRLLKNPSSDLELAGRLRSAWFSGIMQTPLGPKNIGYQHALVWRNSSFLHAAGVCGGPTGYWSAAPTS